MHFGVIEMWQTMGIMAKMVVFVLLAMSVFVVGVSVERWRYYKKGKQTTKDLVLALRELLQKNGGNALERAKGLAAEHENSPLASVVDAASSAFLKKECKIDAMDLVVGINRAVERTIERQTNLLKKNLGGLATIASTAPFVGLFGTVVGIINAFHSMASSGSGGLATVSAGIAEALVVTAFGLLVAIPAVGLYNYFSGVADGFVVDMDEVASEMVEAVVLSHKDELKV